MLSVWWLRKKNVILQAKTENEDMEDNGVMQAAEPTVAYGANSYASVMCLLHNLSITPEVKEQVGRRLMLEVTSKYLSKAFDRLDHLSQLEKNWDGEGALPISCKVINNVKSVLAISEDDDWRNWMIGPDTNATLGRMHVSALVLMSIPIMLTLMVGNTMAAMSNSHPLLYFI